MLSVAVLGRADRSYTIDSGSQKQTSEVQGLHVVKASHTTHKVANEEQVTMSLGQAPLLSPRLSYTQKQLWVAILDGMQTRRRSCQAFSVCD